MTTKAKEFSWVGIAISVIALVSYIWASPATIRDYGVRIGVLESQTTTIQEDLKYIRSRVDEIHDRLPPKGN